ncbi:short-chain dehydrogenase [Virgibacillus oceani]|uniref:Short-chain dehydrogenase n=1 Tax=Virgibacillus oceani TaxID=1479511 RepID=A0A917M1R1_9BACI|nr:short-chain dehydrogenase [Virgibacillus oceani]GGG71185.1 short-chain dehydrogenase [Virgibacillus oceani]
MGNKKHAIVIGGTGMLAKVSHYLAASNFDVSVIARSILKHQGLKENCKNPENIHAILADYHNGESLNIGIENALHTYGCPSIVVSWIHSTAPNALPLIIRQISVQYSSFPWRLFHIQGSSGFFQKEYTPVSENCLYRRVYLGFMIEKSASRWLTHEEISEGVIHAIETDSEKTIVGTVEPWESRP